MQSSPGAELEKLAASAAARPDGERLLYFLAKQCWRAGDKAGYVDFIRRAYQMKPNEYAFELKLAEGSRDEALAVRAKMRALIERNVSYSAILATLTRAEVALGDMDAVDKLVGDERTVRQAQIAPPAGTELDALNRALAEEIKARCQFHAEPRGRAIRNGWRYEGIGRARTPALRALIQILRTEIDRYMAGLPDDPSNPFIAARPAEYDIDGWAVISTASSFHHSHIHSGAWATGVYYVAQPEISKRPGSKTGWLHVGPPPWVPEAARSHWFQRDVAPVPGNFILMPGHYWHATAPLDVEQERICVAFEVQPKELSLSGRARAARQSPPPL